MPKITVAMASYNHEKYVGEAIESVLSQKDCDLEFIIVDDGSQDATTKEIHKFNDSRIHFIPFEKNQGAALAINTCIAKAKGEYIAIINSDDRFLPGKLSKQSAFLDNHLNIRAVFGYPQYIDEKGQRLKDNVYVGDAFKQPNRPRQEWLNYFFHHHNALCHPTVLIRRECYEKVGLYEPRFSKLPDFDFWIRLLLQFEIHILQEDLIQFRVFFDHSNASATSKEKMGRAQWEFSKLLKHYTMISSIEEYLTIFPEDAPNISEKHPSLIPFYIVRLALSKEEPFYHLFGIETLFSLLEDEKMRKTLEEKLDYRHSHFLQDMSIFPILKQRSLISRLKKRLLPKSLKSKQRIHS